MPFRSALSAFSSRFRVLLAVLAGGFVIWLLAGFFLVPAVARPRLEREATAALKRPVTVANLRFNPLTLGATVEGLRIAEPSGGDWVTLRRLYLNFEVWALLQHTVSFAAIEVEGLVVRAGLDAKGRLNFQDLLEGAQLRSSSEAWGSPPTQSESQPPSGPTWEREFTSSGTLPTISA